MYRGSKGVSRGLHRLWRLVEQGGREWQRTLKLLQGLRSGSQEHFSPCRMVSMTQSRWTCCRNIWGFMLECTPGKASVPSTGETSAGPLGQLEVTT